jgi:Domain of unknown function (DUF4157)
MRLPLLRGMAVVLTSFVLLADTIPAFSCPAWDLWCEGTETLKNPGKKIKAVPGKVASQFNASRNELSVTLNKVDPRFTQIGRDIDRWRINFQSQVLTGPALEQWIKQSRNDAIKGARPMPEQIKRAMTGWYSSAEMANVFYKIGDGGALNLGSASTRYGEAGAITLIDVIVFRNPDIADNYATWAHELKHITQYQDWGVHSFAVQYMQSWNSVENPAYEVEHRYATAQEAGQIQGISPGSAASIPFKPGAVIITMMDATSLEGAEVGGGLAEAYGADVLHNMAPYSVDRGNAAKFNFNTPTGGAYKLFIEYAAEDSRAIEVSLNNSAFQPALIDATGGWTVQEWVDLGSVKLNPGANNIRLKRAHVFPHIRKIAFLPIQ